jgi:hypothetical protein
LDSQIFSYFLKQIKIIYQNQNENFVLKKIDRINIWEMQLNFDGLQYLEHMIAYCGLLCDSCPIHLATLEIDIAKQAKMRVEIAEQLAKIYGTSPKPDIITDCDGCIAVNGRLFTGCIDCGIRKCAIRKNLTNCAYCSDYPCYKLEKHYSLDPDSKDRLDEIRRNNL